MPDLTTGSYRKLTLLIPACFLIAATASARILPQVALPEISGTPARVPTSSSSGNAAGGASADGWGMRRS